MDPLSEQAHRLTESCRKKWSDWMPGVPASFAVRHQSMDGVLLGAASRYDEKIIGLECLAEVRASLGDRPMARSLSHSHGLVFTMGVLLTDRIAGLGIDIEPQSREISEAVVSRIALETERRWMAGAHALWTLKEACFKADPSPTKQTMTEYQLINYDADLGRAIFERKCPPDEVRFKFLGQTLTTSEWACSMVIAEPAPLPEDS